MIDQNIIYSGTNGLSYGYWNINENMVKASKVIRISQYYYTVNKNPGPELWAQADNLYCDLSLQLWMQGNIFLAIKQLFGLQTPIFFLLDVLVK